VQFFTTQHTTLSISRYLLSIKKTFQSCKNKTDSFSVSPIIVTDESWASINAICEIFNNCDMATYLKWSYEVLVVAPGSLDLITIMNTRIILCHVHFLHNAIKKLKELKLEGPSYFFFIYGFTLLQNATTIEEFNEILKLLHTIFKQEHCDSDILAKCLTDIDQKILYRNIDVLTVIRQYDSKYVSKQSEKTTLKKLQTIFISDDFLGENFNCLL
jgi:hypothetical protein